MSSNAKPLEKLQQSSELPPLKNKSSVSRTRQGITHNPNEHIDIEVFSHWLDNLDCPSQEAFNAFASDSFSVIEVFLYASFLGYKGSINACEAWVKSRYPKPNHLGVLLAEIEEMQEDIRKLREDIENYTVKRDVGVARIAAMQKELRGTIAQVQSFISNRDQKSLVMAGADRAIRELCAIFKDDVFEAPLHEASLSVWAKIQYEE